MSNRAADDQPVFPSDRARPTFNDLLDTNRLLLEQVADLRRVVLWLAAWLFVVALVVALS